MVADFTIGILRESRDNSDSRVALTPYGAKNLLATNRSLTIYVQPSQDRSFSEQEYMDAGCFISEDLSMCEVLLGVKEPGLHSLLENKSYLFFSHTNKKQRNNQKILQEVLNKKITLIDYEFLYFYGKNRIANFGYWAGLVGAYNVLRAYGIKYGLFALEPVHKLENKGNLINQLSKVVGRNDKILITGNGRVTSGVEEVLQASGIYKVDKGSFLSSSFKDPVYFVAEAPLYVKNIYGDVFSMKNFRKHPFDYESDFMYLAKATNVLITAHYWHPLAPKLFELDEVNSDWFKIGLIGDITCDILGSIPLTKKICSLQESFYDFDPQEKRIETPFSGDKNITIMSIDNLAGALAKESSEYFSTQLVNHVLPYFWNGDYNKVLKKATIAKNGKIKKRYSHLKSFVQEI